MATISRFFNSVGTVNQGKDNTDRIKTSEYLTPAFASTIALKPWQAYTLVQPGTLTGAVTITAGVGSATTAPYVGDEMVFIFLADTTSRTVTFGTGFTPNGTLAVAISKKATATFMFDGTTWLETGRVLLP